MKNGNPLQKLKCPKCGGDMNDDDHGELSIGPGCYVGKSTDLGDYIINKVYGWGSKYNKHPFFYSPDLDSLCLNPNFASEIKDKIKNEALKNNTQGKIEAHHLICSETVNKDMYQKVIYFLGYNINHHKNGVLLPGVLKVACSHKVPLHKSNHDSTFVIDNISRTKKSDFPYFDAEQELSDINYVQKVRDFIKPTFDKAIIDFKCNKQERKEQAEKLINSLDERSQLIFKKIEKFKWTITPDGFDYHPNGWGCLNHIKTKEKMQMLSRILGVDYDGIKESAKAFNAPIVKSFLEQGIKKRDIPYGTLRDANREIQQEIYSKSKEDYSKIPFCDRDHYKNPIGVLPYYKEREEKYRQEFKFKN